MERDANERTAADLADRLLEIRDQKGRVAFLREMNGALSSDLVREIRARARGELRNDPREAGRRACLGILAAQRLGDDDERTDCLALFAQSAVLLGNYRGALQAIDRALPKVTDRRREARLEGIRLQALVHLEWYEEAEQVGTLLTAYFEGEGDWRGAVRSRMTLADLAFRRDRFREALAHYGRVASLLPDDVSDAARGAVAANRANALQAVNRFHAAERNFARARELFDREGNEHTVAQIEYNTAYAEMLRGRFDDALRRLSRAEETFRRLGDDRHLAHIDLDRAEIHAHLNLPEEVRAFATDAEQRFTDLGLVKEAGQAALFAGRGAILAGEPDEAEACLSRAEERFEDLHLSERQFSSVVLRADLATADGRTGEARELADEAEALLSDSSNPLSLASHMLLRARIEIARDRPDQAIQLGTVVLNMLRRVHAPWILIEAHRLIGRAQVLLGRLPSAISAYQSAIGILEEYRGGVPPDEFMAAFLAGRSDLYEEIVALLVQSGETDLAFDFAERAKSRALVDLLSGRPDGAVKPADDTPLSRRVRYLRERLAAVYGRLFRADNGPESRSGKAVAEALREAGELEAQVSRLLRHRQLEAPDAASLETVRPLDRAAISRAVEPGTALLEYFVTKEGLFTFLILGEEVHVVRSDHGEDDLRRLLERFHFHLSKYQRPEVGAEDLQLRATRANLEKLAKILLGPVADQLDARRLVIVPHGVLHHLPFHALPWEDGWVTDRFEVLYAPSAAVYALCGSRRPTATGAPAVFGLPDEFAPQIEDETHRVAEALSSDRVHLRADATFDRLRKAAGEARVLHIATHGMFRDARPMLSSIRMADGWVNLYDLYDLDVRGELVVLSTCESGTAGVTDGDEILGLTRGFLYAGAPALLASQWRVHDAATAEFMSCFYQHLRDRGDAAAAHRMAMREIRERRPHPYYWAPFFLTGRPVAHTTDVAEKGDHA